MSGGSVKEQGFSLRLDIAIIYFYFINLLYDIFVIVNDKKFMSMQGSSSVLGYCISEVINLDKVRNI